MKHMGHLPKVKEIPDDSEYTYEGNNDASLNYQNLQGAARLIGALAEQLEKLSGDKPSKLEQEEKEWLKHQKVGQ